jgi:hypothetical protein
MEIATKRPRGLVPGSIEWLRELQGPKLLHRLIDEIHANPVGEMTPTQARCAGMLIPIIYPALSSVHHTVEGSLSKVSTEELEARFKALVKEQRAELVIESKKAQEVEYIEVKNDDA